MLARYAVAVVLSVRRREFSCRYAASCSSGGGAFYLARVIQNQLSEARVLCLNAMRSRWEEARRSQGAQQFKISRLPGPFLSFWCLPVIATLLMSLDEVADPTEPKNASPAVQVVRAGRRSTPSGFTKAGCPRECRTQRPVRFMSTFRRYPSTTRNEIPSQQDVARYYR